MPFFQEQQKLKSNSFKCCECDKSSKAPQEITNFSPGSGSDCGRGFRDEPGLGAVMELEVVERDLMISLAVPKRLLGFGESLGLLSFLFNGIFSVTMGRDLRRGRAKK